MANKMETIKHSKGRKVSETMDAFVKRRGKETGKVTIPETHAGRFEAGRHPLIALQRHKGIVKKDTAKKMEQVAHKRKKKQIEEGTN